MPDQAAARRKMVDGQLRRRGIDDERVLAAMGDVPREEFLPPDVRSRAYADSALPIAHGQTVSQPWIVAAICQSLRLDPAHRVLEVGTGSGYSTAILARLAASVISVERHAGLAAGAREVLERLGTGNAEVVTGDGSVGLPDRAPFDAIAIHAATPARPRSLISQLAEGGRLIAPIAAGEDREMLTLYTRRCGEVTREALSPVAFVPLIGAEGYAETP